MKQNRALIALAFTVALVSVLWLTSEIGQAGSDVQGARTVAGTKVQAAPGDENWDPRFPGPSGLNGDVLAMARSGDKVYFGGSFNLADIGPVNGIVMWDAATNSWSRLLSGTVDGVQQGTSAGTVQAIAISGTDVYVGGNFNHAGGVTASAVAKWDGLRWSALYSGTAEGVDFFVYSLAIRGSELIVGGNFFNAGGSAASDIARYDGLRWSPLFSGTVEGTAGSAGTSEVNAIVISGTDVIAGGTFQRAGGVTVGHVARWDGLQWSPLLSGTARGVSSTVNSLVVSGSEVIAGGNFDRAGGALAGKVARWNGVQWQSLVSGTANGVNLEVKSLARLGSEIIAGGQFAQAGGKPADRIAIWSGLSWRTLISGTGNGVDSQVNVVVVSGTRVFAGGQFGTASGLVQARHVAQWENVTGWRPLGGLTNNGLTGIGAPGFEHTARRIVRMGDDVFVGGTFTLAGAVTVNNVARLRDATWSALSNAGNPNVRGPNGPVNGLAVSGTNLFAGGSFDHVGTTTTTNIARYDGTNWQAVGSPEGVSGPINVLAGNGVHLYAGGEFTRAGGVSTTNIARWNGVSWSPLLSGTAEGTNGPVHAIYLEGSDVYVGGVFQRAGGISATNIAKWDGLRWSALMSGTLDGVTSFCCGTAVYAILPTLSGIYVGGSFSSIGDSTGEATFNSIALWNGVGYLPLRVPGLTGVAGGTVRDIQIGAGLDEIFVAGDWSVPSLGLNNIARWNGAGWQPLGAGTTFEAINGSSAGGGVNSILISGTERLVGGAFAYAGNKPSHRFGRYTEPPTPSSPTPVHSATPTTAAPTATNSPTSQPASPTPTRTGTPGTAGSKTIFIQTGLKGAATGW